MAFLSEEELNELIKRGRDEKKEYIEHETCDKEMDGIKSSCSNDKENIKKKKIKIRYRKNAEILNDKKEEDKDLNLENEFFNDESYEELDKDSEDFSKGKKVSRDKYLISSKKRKRIIPEQYVDKIIKSENLICLNGNLYLYDDSNGAYYLINMHDTDVLIKKHIMETHKKYLVKYDIDSIKALLKADFRIQNNEENIEIGNNFINCKKGIVDICEKKMYAHHPEIYFFNCINVDGNKKWDEKKFRKTRFYRFIKEVTDDNKELEILIQEVSGYIISNFYNAKKFFILYGCSNSGKSVFLDLLEEIIGNNNISNIPLHKLSDERYSAELHNKIANIYNELPDEGIKDLGSIKGLVSPNDKIMSRRLYQQPFSFQNKASLIFATNTLPEINIKLYNDTSAFYNRVIIIPFVISIKEKHQDKDLIYKLKNEKEIIFQWMIQGLIRYIDNEYHFTKCKISDYYLEKYKNQENIVGLYIKEYLDISESEYVFWEDIKTSFYKFMKSNDKNNISCKEYRFLKEEIERIYRVKCRRLNRKDGNRYGFLGITFK